MNNRIDEALELSEKILEDIEMEKISISSIALRCLRLARLTNDSDAMKWFEYEVSGYPHSASNTLEGDAFEIAYSRGRKVANDNPTNKRVFSTLADELESEIEADKLAIKSIKSEGVSVSGEWAAAAMGNFTNVITDNLKKYVSGISDKTEKLSIIRGNYYKYVLSVNYELKFSGRVDELFNKYRSSIDSSFIELIPASLKKLDAIYNNLSSDNKESWSQSLTTCRRFFQDVADNLFSKYLPDFNEGKYKTISGKDLDITGDKYINRLYAIIDSIQQKKTENTITGSHIMYIVDWIDKLHDNLCKGVHSDISFEEAERAVIHTYTCLGDICSIMKNV
jgi:hypothetical protein